MLARNYFKKNGFIYGDRKYDNCVHHFYKFKNWDEAQKWVTIQDNNNKYERELICKTEAIKRGITISKDKRNGYDFDSRLEWEVK